MYSLLMVLLFVVLPTLLVVGAFGYLRALDRSRALREEDRDFRNKYHVRAGTMDPFHTLLPEGVWSYSTVPGVGKVRDFLPVPGPLRSRTLRGS